MKFHKMLYVLALTLAVLFPATGRAQNGAQTILTSLSSTNQPGNGFSFVRGVSANARHVVFTSDSTNLVPNDTNGVSDIFVRDTLSGITRRVSVSSSGAEGNGASDSFAGISSDGTFVVFQSAASNLVANDTNQVTDIFLHFLPTSQTIRISQAPGGGNANAASGDVTLSPDNRFVGFASTASNLVSGDTNGVLDVFIYDLYSNVTARVSVNSLGSQGNGQSLGPKISHGGRYVAFSSWASNLISNDANGTVDVFVRDLYLGRTVRASESFTGGEGNNSSADANISVDGRYVVFTSRANNLIIPDISDADVFRKDLKTGMLIRATVDSQGNQGHTSGPNGLGASTTSDGRFVAFTSPSPNLIANDNNLAWDVFLRDVTLGTTILVSQSTNNVQGNFDSDLLAIGRNGQNVAFSSMSNNLSTIPVNNVYNSYTRQYNHAFGNANLLGWGCGGSVGDLPSLYVDSPILGTQMTISGDSTIPNSIGFLLVSNRLASAIHLGQGCYFYLDPNPMSTLAVITSDSQGKWQFQFPVPSNPALRGAKVTFQAIFAGTGIWGFDVSSGVEVIVGD